MSDTTRTKLTYDDYLLLPEDGLQHEIIDGEHYMNAAPNLRHQRISRRIQFQLYQQIELMGRGEVFDAPVDVVCSSHDVVQPDILVVLSANEGIARETHLRGAPDLVVEILSPSTSSRDWTLKRALYQRTGVREYWIVDPEAHLLHQHVLEGAAYRLVGTHRSRVEPATIEGIVVELDPVW